MFSKVRARREGKELEFLKGTLPFANTIFLGGNMLWLRCINIVGFWRGVEEPWREARESAGQRVCQPQLRPGAKGKVGKVQWPLGQKQARLRLAAIVECP